MYFGRLAKSDIIQKIEKYSADEASKELIEPVDGHTFFATLILDEQGRPDPKSYLHPTYLHGINCFVEKKLVEEVINRSNKVQEYYELRYAIQQPTSEEEENLNRKGAVVIWKQINEEIAYLQKMPQLWYSDVIQLLYVAKEVSKTNNAKLGTLIL